jgi:3-phenylpropionate/trans-cinnamate dioxygenase ferredoxin reductase subunit
LIEPIVVVGGGLAAVSFMSELRTGDHHGPIIAVTDETELPYDKPPLSKDYQVHGNCDNIRLDLTNAPEIDWRRGVAVSRLDTRHREVQLSDGRKVRYGTLVLAMGATPRQLPALQSAPVPVLTLRTLEDARRIRAAIGEGKRLALIGGGVIGLELAATARGLGTEVTVVEAQRRVMNRCAPEALASAVAARHVEEGVDLRLGRQMAGFAGGDLLLDDGSRIRADAIVVAIGVTANDQIARDAGIACDDGIFVDGQGRTTAPGVYAIGDVTRRTNSVSGRFERIETWSNAYSHGRATAQSLLDPGAPPFRDVPWYWSDQYELRIQVAGSTSTQEIVRGTPGPRSKFTLVQVQRGRVVGVACMNNPREFTPIRRLLAEGGATDIRALGDPAVDLGRYLRET